MEAPSRPGPRASPGRARPARPAMRGLAMLGPAMLRLGNEQSGEMCLQIIRDAPDVNIYVDSKDQMIYTISEKNGGMFNL